MGGLFRIDSKLMRFGTKLGYLLWLQLLTVVCALPIITAGASFTAMHKLLLEIYRDSESHITRTFLKSFRENLGQATALWLIYIGFFSLLALDYWFSVSSSVPALRLAVYILPVLALAGYLSFMWVFPLQSRYENSIWKTIKLSFTLLCFRPLTTIIMAVLTCIPLVLLMLTMYAFPYLVFFGITVPGLLQTILYSRIFDFLEGTSWRREKALEQME